MSFFDQYKRGETSSAKACTLGVRPGEALFCHRMRNGWSEHDALTREIRFRPGKLSNDFLGQEFPSESEMCRYWHIPLSTFRKRLEAGWDLKKSLTTPCSVRGKKKDVEDIIDVDDEIINQPVNRIPNDIIEDCQRILENIDIHIIEDGNIVDIIIDSIDYNTIKKPMLSTTLNAVLDNMKEPVVTGVIKTLYEYSDFVIIDNDKISYDAEIPIDGVVNRVALAICKLATILNGGVVASISSFKEEVNDIKSLLKRGIISSLL